MFDEDDNGNIDRDEFMLVSASLPLSSPPSFATIDILRRENAERSAIFACFRL